MTKAQLDQLSAALVAHSEASRAVNQKLFADIRAVPGGEEILRQMFAQSNTDRETQERILRGEARLGDAACLAGLKISQS